METHRSAAESEGQTQPRVPDLPVLISWTSQALWQCIFLLHWAFAHQGFTNKLHWFAFLPCPSFPPFFFPLPSSIFNHIVREITDMLQGWESSRSLPGSVCPRAWQSCSSCCSNETAPLHLIIFYVVASMKI